MAKITMTLEEFEELKSGRKATVLADLEVRAIINGTKEEILVMIEEFTKTGKLNIPDYFNEEDCKRLSGLTLLAGR